MKQPGALFCAMVLCAALGCAQGTTASLDGTVTDPQGASIADAQVEVVNVNTRQVFRSTSDIRGHWVIPAMAAAVYRVTVSKPGFKSATIEDVAMNAGVPASVNVKLELGQVTEVVEVSAGAEIVQASSATVSSTVTGRQVFELPFTSRNTLELIVTQPGTQTPTYPRTSSINGLPQGAVNITIDGANIQDNYLKSSEFFTRVFTPVDAIEEVTLATAAAGADSLGQGAAQIKFVTKSGTNQFHGGAFWQVRNSWFNSNYYFNNLNGQPRDIIKLNQGGGRAGGPIKKDKLFFFVNYEIYRLPGSQSYTRAVLTDTARAGIFTYQDSAKQIRTVDLYKLVAAANANLPAGTRPYATTPDPVVGNTLSQVASLYGNGALRSRVATNSDYNRMDLRYQPTGLAKRTLLVSRIDYNVTDKHHLALTWNYNKVYAIPDLINDVVPIYPGTGTVLGNDVLAGQRSIRFAGTAALRSALSPRVTNELRGSATGGTTLWQDALTPALFSQWKGYVPSFAGGWISGVTSTSSQSRRLSPVKDVADTVSLVTGPHQLSFGGNFSHVRVWYARLLTFNVATGDPINTGSTGIFNTTNFPGATPSNLSDAASLYAILTGRVSAISKGVAIDEKTRTYGAYPATNRDSMKEYGLFAHDTWRLVPGFTLNLGLRYERQLPFQNNNGTYTRVGMDGLYGLSGVGNLFAPGVMTGVVPTYKALTSGGDAYEIPAVWAPSAGFAWQLPAKEGFLGRLLGGHRGASVLRAGYAIATIREGTNTFTSIWGSNTGRTYDASLSASTFPADFGAPGSVWYRDPALPLRSDTPTKPSFPIAANFTSSLNDFDPHLKLGYVQSWNIGFQRELGKDMVMEIRYTGNHGLHQWRQYNLNEVNIFENGFLNEFKIAANNLAIARRTNPTTNNFGNQGLAGQQNIPIISTALGTTNDVTSATYLDQGRAGTLANAISSNATRLGNLTRAGYPANFFVVNPTVAGGSAWIMSNDGSSFYDALQVESRRRLSRGLMFQGSYAWGKSLANGATSSSTDADQPTTLRNLRLNRQPSEFDIRHAIKLNWIYELPFGPGRPLLSSVQNPVARKALQGWQIAGVSRIQSGTPSVWGGRGTVNQNDNGVVYYNMTADQLQDMVHIRKTTAPDGKGIVYYLPQSLIDNTMAAWEVGGKTRADLKPDQPYIGWAAPGQMGSRLYFYRTWQRHLDVSLVKTTKIGERYNVQFRCQALDVLNLTNFLPSANIGSSLGQVTAAYRDMSNTTNPGGRIIEFVLRFNF
jgi:hypothetical protein